MKLLKKFGWLFLTLITILVMVPILISFIYHRSRAERITSNEEYIQQLTELSRGKKLAGNLPTPSLKAPQNNINSGHNIFIDFYNYIFSIFK